MPLMPQPTAWRDAADGQLHKRTGRKRGAVGGVITIHRRNRRSFDSFDLIGGEQVETGTTHPETGDGHDGRTTVFHNFHNSHVSSVMQNVVHRFWIRRDPFTDFKKGSGAPSSSRRRNSRFHLPARSEEHTSEL